MEGMDGGGRGMLVSSDRVCPLEMPEYVSHMLCMTGLECEQARIYLPRATQDWAHTHCYTLAAYIIARVCVCF